MLRPYWQGKPMPRKPTETVKVNLRLKEAVRRRLEREAKKRGVSLNYEMTSRIEQTFNIQGLRDQETITADMQVAYARFVQPFHDLATQGDLRRAAELLVTEIERMPAECRERDGVLQAMAAVKQATAMIDLEATMAIRRMGHV
jgi:hypothetical protein